MAKMPTTDEWVEKIGNKTINEYVYNGKTLKEWIDLMASGKLVVTPDNATNGDVIKAIFPDAENIRMDNGLPLNFVLEFELHRNYKDWWNAPYKVGDKEL